MKYLKFILKGMSNLFNIHTFSTPIYDRIKPDIELDTRKSFEKDRQSLQSDYKKAFSELEKIFKNI